MVRKILRGKHAIQMGLQLKVFVFKQRFAAAIIKILRRLLLVSPSILEIMSTNPISSAILARPISQSFFFSFILIQFPVYFLLLTIRIELVNVTLAAYVVLVLVQDSNPGCLVKQVVVCFGNTIFKIIMQTRKTVQCPHCKKRKTSPAFSSSQLNSSTFFYVLMLKRPKFSDSCQERIQSNLSKLLCISLMYLSRRSCNSVTQVFFLEQFCFCATIAKVSPTINQDIILMVIGPSQVCRL